MKTYVKKSSDNQQQTVAHAVTQQQNRANANAQFIGNRAENFGFRQLQKEADNSPQASGLVQLKAMIGDGSRSAAMQNLQARVNNSPYQVVQRRQHSRVQGVSMVAPSGFSGMKHISKPLGRIIQLASLPKDSIGTINKKWTFPKQDGEEKEVSGKDLQNNILKLAKCFAEDPTGFRLGSFIYKKGGILTALPRNNSMGYEEDHKMTKLPESATNDARAMNMLDRLLSMYILGTLTDAGQIQYIKNNADQIFKTHIVVIDVDCQFDRWGDVAFHKDSRGTTAFVNLTFSNEEKMQGTDYYEDLDGDPGLENKLPEKVIKDINKRRKEYSGYTGIKSPELQPYGRISFSDPNLYHSTPLMRSRKKPTGKEDREFLINYLSLEKTTKYVARFIGSLEKSMHNLDDSQDVKEAKFVMDDFIKSMKFNLPYLNASDLGAAYTFLRKEIKKFLKKMELFKDSENNILKTKAEIIAKLKISDFFLKKEDFENDKDEVLRKIYAMSLEEYNEHGFDKMSEVSEDDQKGGKALKTAKRERRLSMRLNSKDDPLTQADLDKQKEKPRTFIRTWVRFVPKN